MMKNNSEKLMHDIEEGIIIIDSNGTIMHINPKVKNNLGLNKEYESLK